MEIRAIQSNTGSDVSQIFQAAPSTSSQPKPEPKVTASTESVTISAQGSEAARLAKAVDNLSNFMRVKEANIAFSIDDNSGRMLVRVIDQDTKEILRQIPSKEALAISDSIDKIAQQIRSQQDESKG